MANKVLKLDNREISRAITFYVSNKYPDFLPAGTEVIIRLMCKGDVFEAQIEEEKSEGANR